MRSTFHDESSVEMLPRRRNLTPEESFGKAFREERVRHANLTQVQLSEKSEIPLGLIASLESGERRGREMTLEQLEKIATVFQRRLILDPLPDHENGSATLGVLLYHARQKRKPLTPTFVAP